MKEVDELASDLCTGRADDDEDKKGIDHMVENHHKCYDSLCARVESRKKKVEDAVPVVEKYNPAFSELNVWLSELEPQVKELEPIGIVPEKIKEQLDEHSAIGDKLNGRKPDFENVVSFGNEVLAIPRPEGDTGAKEVIDELTDLQKRWNEAVRLLNERQGILTIYYTKSQPYYQIYIILETWLVSVHDRMAPLEETPAPTTPEAIQENVAVVEAIQQEFSAYEPEWEKLSEAADDFANSRPEDDPVRDEIKGKVSGLNDKCKEAKSSVDDKAKSLHDSLADSQKAVGDLDNVLKFVEEKQKDIDSAELPDVEPEQIEKQLAEHQALSDLVNDFEPREKEVEDCVGKLVENAKPDDPLKAELEKLQREWPQLTSAVDDRKAKLDDALKKAHRFKKVHGDMSDWLDDTEKELDAMAPISTQPEKLDEQKEACKVFQEKVEAQKPMLDDVHTAADELLSDTPEDSPKRAQIDSAVKEDDDRYKALEAKLAERQHSLDDGRDKVDRFEKAKAAFVPWLEEAEEKAKTFTEPEGEPEKLKQQQEETRAFNSEVATQKPELDEVIAACNDLLSDHSPEEEGVQETQDQVKDWVDRYNNLTVVVKERWTTLMSSIEIATQFTELYEILVTYIVASVAKVKEWPPIALLFEPLKQQSDDYKEFESDVSGKRHEVESVLSKGEELVAKSKSPEVEEKIAGIRKQWDDLEEEVKQYRLKLDETLEKSERFQTAYDTFDEYLKEKEVAVKSLPTVGVRPDELAKQNEEVQIFVTDLEEHEPELKEFDDLAADLCAGRLEDDEHKQPIDAMQKNHHKRYKALTVRSGKRKKNMAKALPIAEKYNPAFADLNVWLGELEPQVKELEPIGIVPEKIKEQLDNHSALCENLNSRKPDFENVVAFGNELLAIPRPEADTGSKEVVDELTDLQNRWNEVVRLLNERQGVLTIYYTKSQPYYQIYVILETWLVSVHDRMAPLEETPAPTTPETIQEKAAVVEAIQQEFSAYEPEWEKLSAAADDFANSRPEDDPVRDEIKRKVSGLNDKCKEERSAVDDKAKSLHDSLADSQKAVGDLDDVLKFVEEKQKEIDSAETPDVEPEQIEKQLAEHQALSDLVNDFGPREKEVEDCVGKLVENAKPDDPLKAELEKLQRDWPQLTSAVEARKTKLDDALEKAHRFKKVHGDMSDWLDDTEKELDAMAPISTQPEKLDEQKDACKIFQDKVEAQKPVLDDVHTAADELLSDTPEDSPKRAQIDSAVKDDDDRYKNLEAKLAERQRSLDDGRDKVDRFEKAKAAFVPWLEEAEKKAKTFTEPEGEPEKLKQQQEETRAFNSEVATQKPELDDVIAASSDLLSNHSPDEEGVQETQDQVKDWVDRYNNLTVVVKERWTTLMSSIEIATQFTDLYEVLVTYIVAGVAKVKEWPPIALLFEPLKQQTDDFEEFESDVSGKRHEVESVLSKGEELVAKSKSPEVKEKIAGIRKQWDELEEEVKQYRLRLDETLEKSERFQTAYETFDEYLKGKEEAVKNLPTAGIRQDELIKQNEEVQMFTTDLEEHEPELKELDDLATDLCSGRSDDDEHKQPIDVMQSNHHTRYDALKRVADDRKKDVENALPIAEKYNPAFSELHVWLSELEPQVKELKPIGIVPEKIKEQLDEHSAICEKLNSRKPDFENVVSSGNELLAIPRPEGDTGAKEVVDELNDLQDRWNEVVRLLNERQGVLTLYYTKSQPYYQTYIILETWLVSVHDRMAPLEEAPAPTTPEAIQENVAVVEAIQQEFSTYEPEWEKLSEAADDFANSRPEDDPVRDEIKGKVSGLNDKCKEEKSSVDDKAKSLHDSLADSQKAVGDLDDVLKFVEEKQKDIDSAELPDVEPEQIEKQLAEHQALSDLVNDFEPREKEVEDCVGKLVEKAKPDDPLKAELEKLQRDWPQLTSAVEARKTKLDDALEKAHRFKKVHGDMSDWLDDTEKELDAMAPISTQPETLDEQKEACRVFQDKVEAQKPVLDDVHTAADELLSDTPEGSPKRTQIDSAVKDDDDRYKNLEAKLAERQRLLDDGRDKVDRFEKAKAAFVPWLEEAEEKAKTFTEPEGEPEKLKQQQEETRAFNSEVATQKPELDDVIAASSDLLSNHSPDEEGVQETQDQVKGWVDRYNNLTVVVKERWTTLMSSIEIATQFTDLYEVLVTYIVAGVAKVKEWPPIALLFEPLKQQTDDFEEFESDVSGKRHEVESVLLKGEELLAKSKSPEVKEKIAGIRKQWDELEEEVKQYRLRLDETLEKSERFQAAYDTLDEYLNEKEVAVKSLPTVGVRPDELAKQSEEVQIFLTDLEEHEPELKEFDDLAADLCAGRPEDDEHKQPIDAMQKNHHKRYKALKVRSGKRRKNMAKALPIAEKYNPAFADLNVWLSDLEPQMKDLEPIGIVPEKIKEQLDDHSALCENLNSRKPDFENVVAFGNELLAIPRPEADTGTKEVVDELTDLQNRWNEVVRLLNERQGVLTIYYTKSQPYYQIYVILETWLVSVHDRMAPLEETPAPTTPETIQEKAAVVEAIQQEFSAYEPEWEKLSAAADDFANSRPEDDPVRDEIKGKVSGLNDKCKEEKSAVDDKAKSLHDSLADSQKAVGDLDDVLKFVEEKQKEIDSAETPDVEPEQIEKQLAEHQALSDLVNDFEPREKEVEDCVGKLVENAKPDDPLKAELEKLQRDWPQLTSAVEARKTKLDDALEKAHRFKKVHGDMSDWLDDTEKELDAMAPISTQPEKLDEQKEACKVFQDKVEAQKPVLDDVHTAADELLSDTPEDSPKRSQIDSAVKEDDDRYKALEAKLAERQRLLDDGRDKVDRFEKAKAAFVPWLEEAEEKAKTFTEPEGEPEKLKQQQEETRAFNSEVATQKPELDEVIAASSDLLSNHSPEEEGVQETQDQVKDWVDRYNGLTVVVKERWTTLMSSIEIATQFTDLYEILVTYIVAGVAKVKEWPPIALLYEPLQQQSDNFKEFESDVSGKRHEVESVLSKGEELVAKSKSPEVKEKIAGIRKQWDELEEEVKQYRLRLDETLEKSERFQAAYDTFDEYLKGKEEAVKNLPTAGIRPDELMKQNEEVQMFTTDLEEHEPELKEIDDLAADLCSGRSDDDEHKQPIEVMQSNHHTRYDALKRVADDRKKKIEKALPLAEKYNPVFSELNVWLSELEPQVKELEPIGIVPEKIKEQLDEHSALCEQLNGRKPDFENVVSSGNELLAIPRPEGDSGAKEVVDELTDLQNRWNEVVRLLNERQGILTIYYTKSQPYYQIFVILETWLVSVHDRMAPLEEASAPTTPEAIQENVAVVEAIQQEFSAYEPEWEKLSEAADDFANSRPEDDPVRDEIKGRVSGLNDKCKEEKSSVDDKAKSLHDSLADSQKAVGDLDDVLKFVEEKQKEVDSAEAPDVEPEQIEKQLAEHQALSDLVNDFEPREKEVEDCVGKLVEDAKPDDPLKAELEKLQREWPQLTSSVAARKTKLDDALDKAHRFKKVHGDMSDWLDDTEKELDAMAPISTRPEKLDEQKEACKVFQDKVEAQKPVLDDVHTAADELLSDTPEDSPKRTQIDSAVKEDDDRYKNLETKLAERQRSLDDGRDKVDRFEKAKAAFVPWLEEAEEKAKTFTEPEGEPEKLKQQQEETRAFNSEVATQKPELDEVIAACNDLLSDHSPEEEGVQETQDQVKDWVDRYNNLTVVVKERWTILMSSIEIATQFTDLYEVLVTYIVAGVAKVKEWPPIALLFEPLKQQSDDYKEFESDVSGKRHEVESVLSKGEELVAKSKSPEVEEKIAGIRKQWDELEEEVKQYRSKLDETLEKSERFQTAYDTFNEYLEAKERDAKNLPSVGVRPDEVEKQCEEVKTFVAELLEHEPELKQFDDLATDLCSGRADDDEHKKPIDIMRSNHHKRYDSLKKRVTKKQATFENAVPIVAKYDVAFAELNAWLNDLEPIVKNLPPIGVVPENLQREIDEHKALCDRLNGRKPDFDNVVACGNELLAIPRRKNDPNVKTIVDELSNLQDRWNEVVRLLNERQGVLGVCFNKSQIFYNVVVVIETWLVRVDERLRPEKTTPAASNPTAIQGEIATVEVRCSINNN